MNSLDSASDKGWGGGECEGDRLVLPNTGGGSSVDGPALPEGKLRRREGSTLPKASEGPRVDGSMDG